jgi:hypothetical protein
MLSLVVSYIHRYVLYAVLTIFFVSITACDRHTLSRSSVEHPRQVTDSFISEGNGWVPSVWKEFLASGPVKDNLPDFSYAGYRMGESHLPENNGPIYDVTSPDFGAIPDDGADDTLAIQKAIDTAGKMGGGIVLLPKGRYDIHSTPDMPLLTITHSRIVLRGEGSTETGTILHLGAPGPDRIIQRLGFIPARKEARSSAVISVQGNEGRVELIAYTGDVMRGEMIAKVSDTDGLSDGQMVAIDFTDQMIDPKSPAPEKIDLTAQLNSPFRFTKDQFESFGRDAATHTWLINIKKVIDKNTIRLSRPARFDQYFRYTPRIYSFEGVYGVGIEHLRIETSWPGGYRHHKPYTDTDGKIIRTKKEQDYLWNGIWFSFAVNSWVRDVVFKDITQGIIVSKSAQMTIEDTNFIGIDGHAGITIAHSNDVLVNRAEFRARMIHPITLKNHASGNVITGVIAHYEGDNQPYGADSVIDFHGLAPYENLFEKMQGFYVCPGGDTTVLPHAGVRNVFWNIKAPFNMSCYTGSGDDEFARSENKRYTSSGTFKTIFEHFPQSFYIGITRKEGKRVTVSGSIEDQKTPWFTVEGMGREGIAIPSLYRAQLAHRLGQ